MRIHHFDMNWPVIGGEPDIAADTDRATRLNAAIEINRAPFVRGVKERRDNLFSSLRLSQKALTAHCRNPTGSAQPKPVRCGEHDLIDAVTGEAFLGREVKEPVLIPAVQTAASCANPDF